MDSGSQVGIGVIPLLGFHCFFFTLSGETRDQLCITPFWASGTIVHVIIISTISINQILDD